MQQQEMLRLAIQQAADALARGDEPYGAVILSPEGTLLAAAGNEENTRTDPTAHAEILAIRRAAAARGSKSLKGCHAVCNYRPCPMCAAALLMTGIEDWYIGSAFQGPEALFSQTAKAVAAGTVRCSDRLAEEECTLFVQEGRKKLLRENSDYHSGHKNGII